MGREKSNKNLRKYHTTTSHHKMPFHCLSSVKEIKLKFYISLRTGKMDEQRQIFHLKLAIKLPMTSFRLLYGFIMALLFSEDFSPRKSKSSTSFDSKVWKMIECTLISSVKKNEASFMSTTLLLDATPKIHYYRCFLMALILTISI